MEDLSSIKLVPGANHPEVGNRCSSKSESETWVRMLACLLGCTAQTYKPCTHPASILKKEPGVRDRDINGLKDKRTVRPEARSAGQHRTIHRTDHRSEMAEGAQDKAASSTSGGKGAVPN